MISTTNSQVTDLDDLKRQASFYPPYLGRLLFDIDSMKMVYGMDQEAQVLKTMLFDSFKEYRCVMQELSEMKT